MVEVKLKHMKSIKDSKCTTPRVVISAWAHIVQRRAARLARWRYRPRARPIVRERGEPTVAPMGGFRHWLKNPVVIPVLVVAGVAFGVAPTPHCTP